MQINSECSSAALFNIWPQPLREMAFKNADFKFPSFGFFNISEKNVSALIKLLFPELFGPIKILILANSNSEALIFLKF